jgi:large-conductance mechanosensitive channel
MALMKEFKEFIMKGNVVDLAVAVLSAQHSEQLFLH